MEKFSKIISDIFLWIMNIGLLIIGVFLFMAHFFWQEKS